MAAWTLVMVLSLVGNLYQEHQALLEVARTEARSLCEQITLFRQWNALHGGVYVAVDKNSPPNPLLSLNPERDLRTPSGRTLTLVNPAYMARQVYELAQRQNKPQGRIVSLKPLRPENAPDFWETWGLDALEQGAREFSTVEHLPDQDYVRLIKPLVVEKSCLECHAAQGYKVGDIRGGISVSVPLAPLRVAGRQHLTVIWGSHILLWLLGLGGIGLASVHLGRSMAKQQLMEASLEESNQTLEALIKAAPLAIVDLDPHGSVRFWNPAAESIFGWKASEVMGEPPPFLTKGMQKEFQELFSRGLQGEQVHGEGECKHKNGFPMEISFSLSPLYKNNSELGGVMAMLEDITLRKQVEEELYKANEKLKAWVFEIGQRNRDITLLNEMGDVLQACHTVEEAYAGMGQYAPQMFTNESGALFVFNVDRNILEAKAVWGKSSPGALAFAPDECWALRMGQEHVVKTPNSTLTCAHLAGAVDTSYICIPLNAHGETLGLFLLFKDPTEDSQEAPIDESKQRLAATAAKQFALSLANLNLRITLMQQAIHDPLTGLFNRRYMEEMLEREILRVQRKNAPLGIIMLDLDHFKHFNDSFGHEAGDHLLRILGNILQTNIRKEDIACRYGGEEFILILPETNLETTRERAEKIRQAVQNLKVEYQGEYLGTVTVSLGVAVLPNHGDRGEVVIRAADAALYRAKQRGRNLVAVAGEIAIETT